MEMFGQPYQRVYYDWQYAFLFVHFSDCNLTENTEMQGLNIAVRDSRHGVRTRRADNAALIIEQLGLWSELNWNMEMLASHPTPCGSGDGMQ